MEPSAKLSKVKLETKRQGSRERELDKRLAEAFEQQAATAEILRIISDSPADAQPVFDAIAKRGATLCGAKFAFVTTFDGEWIHMRATYGPGAEEHREHYPIRPGIDSVAARVIHYRAPVQIPDFFEDADYAHKEGARKVGIRSGFGAPMMRKGQILGAITLARPEPGVAPDNLARLLLTFADQAAIAIENVRLFKALEARTAELTQSVGELRALGEVGQAVSSTLDLETVLRTIVSRATALAGLDGGAIYEYDERREEFHLHATDKLPDELVEALRAAPIRKGEGALGRMAAFCEAVQIHDVGDASVYQSRVREILIRLGYRAVLAVPLLREKNLLGGLVVNRMSAGEFTPQVIELLKTFATQSALAIQNARLFREIEEKNHEVGRQADALKEWNLKLEHRVDEQVAELQRLGQLKRFFSAHVADAIVAAGDHSILAAHRREISYVFVDLRGFTAFTDAAEPEEVEAVLRDYQAAMGGVAIEYDATFDRFAGDGILIFFNDPLPISEPGKRAATMALVMQARFASLRERWSALGYNLGLGIGIAQGFATLGAFGFEGRWDYSAIGSVVNLASRLSDEARSGQVLIDRRTRAALGDAAEVVPVGPLKLKGYAQPVVAFLLERLGPS